MSEITAADRFATLTAGMTAERSRTVTHADILHFAEATGDHNPVHLDEEAGRRSMFGSRIAHGMLSAGFISAAISGELPGPGAIYLSQTLRFTLPVRIGDVITAHIEVKEVNPSRRRLTLATTCVNQRGETVVEGEAVVKVPAPPAPPEAQA